MSIKTIRMCDLCKKETEKADLCSIDFRIANNARKFPVSGSLHWKTIDICVDCLREKGFEELTKGTQAGVAEHNEQTLEDKLVNILSEIGVAFED